MKSQHFGEGLGRTRSRSAGRYTLGSVPNYSRCWNCETETES